MEFSQGQKITVRGKSQKGKNRVHFWGEKWVVCRLDKLPNRIGICSPKDNDSNEDYGTLPNSFRWVDLPEDSDIEILEA